MNNMYFLLLLTTALSQTPAPPQWPPVWSLNFTETVFSIPYGTNTFTGVAYYDSTLNLYRKDLSSGRYDPFCGQNDWFSFFDTPCSHIYNYGIRYIVYPSLQICCNCCSEEDGCGVPGPNWLQGATYQGQFNYDGTTPAYLWTQNGTTVYWETVDPTPTNRLPLEIDYIHDAKVFVPQLNEFNVNIFNKPTYCASALMCDSSSACASVRGSGGKSELLKELRK